MRTLLILIGLFFTHITMAFTYTLEIPEYQLQEKLEAKLPIEQKKLFVTVRIPEAQINLIKETNQVGIFAHVETIVPGGLKGSGRAKVIGSLEYDPENGAFYFKDILIESIEIDRIPNTLSASVKELTQVAFKRVLNHYPVYRFKDENTRHKLAKNMLKEIKVEGDVLYLTLSPF